MKPKNDHMKFLDSVETMPFLADDFDYEKDYLAIIRKWEKLGYVVAPDWMPVRQPGYEWGSVNNLTAMMKPKPRWRDWLRFWPKGFLQMRRLRLK